MDWFETINNIVGAVSEAGSVIPGPIGFGSNLVNIASGGAGTATSTGVDAGVAAAGTWGSIAGIPAGIMGLMGTGTGVSIGGLSTIAGAGGGFGSGAAATSAGAAAAGGAAATGAVLGAGAAGYGVGTLMSKASDSDYTRTGFWGLDDSGRDRSAMDWGSNWGTALDSAIGTEPGDWSVPGAIAAGAGGIVGGVAGTVQSGWNALGSLF
jgi:hypothetical protein